MNDTTVYYVAAPDGDSALEIAWNERTSSRPDNPSLALHPADIPARWREAYGHVYRVRVGERWQDGKPVPVAEVGEVEL